MTTWPGRSAAAIGGIVSWLQSTRLGARPEGPAVAELTPLGHFEHVMKLYPVIF